MTPDAGQPADFSAEQLTELHERATAAESAAVEALSRGVSGTYGRCEVCGAPIAYERLLARPAATRCIVHAGT